MLNSRQVIIPIYDGKVSDIYTTQPQGLIYIYIYIFIIYILSLEYRAVCNIMLKLTMLWLGTTEPTFQIYSNPLWGWYLSISHDHIKNSILLLFIPSAVWSCYKMVNFLPYIDNRWPMVCSDISPMKARYGVFFVSSKSYFYVHQYISFWLM